MRSVSSQNVYFFFSSGTSTSKSKLIPYFDSSLAKSASSVGHQTRLALLQRLSFNQTICTTFNFVYLSISSIQLLLLQQVISPEKICQQSSMVPLCRKRDHNRSRVQGNGCFCTPFSQQDPNAFATALNVRQPPWGHRRSRHPSTDVLSSSLRPQPLCFRRLHSCTLCSWPHQGNSDAGIQMDAALRRHRIWIIELRDHRAFHESCSSRIAWSSTARVGYKDTRNLHEK